MLLAATIQVMATLPHARLLEMDGSNNAVYHELLEEPLPLIDGKVAVPSLPGLGVKLPASVVEACSPQHSFEVSL